MKTNSLATLLITAVLLMQGCAPALLAGGALAGVGLASYVKGELIATESATLDQAWEASEKALVHLGFLIVERQRDGLTGRLTARGAEDKKVEINFKREAIHITQLKIRVGLFGDETLSRHVLREIQRRLGTLQSE